MVTIVEIRRARLRELVKEAGSQAALARKVEKDKNQINQWLGKGTARDMENDTARMFESLCGKSLGWMDTMPPPTSDEGPEPASADNVRNPSLVWVNKINGARLSAGNGEVIYDLEEQQNSHGFREDYMQRRGLKANRCKLWTVKGDSMEPRYSSGDVVLIDMSDREPRHGKIFAIVGDNELRIKQLIKDAAGWSMRSLNPDKVRYPDEPIASEGVAVIGRVRWRGGDED